MLQYLILNNLFSAKDDYNIDKESYHSLTISSEGNISRYFPTIYKSSCKLDVRNFPFDDQVTTLNKNSNFLFRMGSLQNHRIMFTVGSVGRHYRPRYRPTVRRVSVDTRPIFSADSRSSIARVSAVCRSSIARVSVDISAILENRSTIGELSVDYR